MLSGEEIRLRRIEKADLWHLWEWHENDELYLFKSIKPFISWDELYDNFNDHFAWKGDFIIQDKESTILGICSYHKVNWKNRSCSISFKMQKDYCDLIFSIDMVQVLTSLIFNSFNLIKINTSVPGISSFEIQTFEKTGFVREGVLREHIFRDNQYLDMYVFSLFREDVNNND